MRNRHAILSRGRRTSSHKSSRPLNSGGIAGVVVGVFVVLVILFTLYLYARRRKRSLVTETIENRASANINKATMNQRVIYPGGGND